MPKTSADDLRQAVADLANASPVIAAGRAIASVGATAQDLVEKAKKIILPGQGPRKADISLPNESRRKKR